MSTITNPTHKFSTIICEFFDKAKKVQSAKIQDRVLNNYFTSLPFKVHQWMQNTATGGF